MTVTLRKENSLKRNRLLRRSTSKGRSGSGRKIKNTVVVDEKIPSNVIGDSDVEDINSRRLVEYFVVYSCKPRVRHGPQTEGTDEQKFVHESGNGATANNGSMSSHEPPLDHLRPPGTPITNNTFRKSFNHSNTTLSSEDDVQENKKVVTSIIRENLTIETNGDDFGLKLKTTITDQTPIRDSTDIDKAKREPGASENIHMPNITHIFTEGSRQELYFVPIQTARYPMTDHRDNPLNPMISHFCFPTSQIVELTTEYKMPRVHHFVLTDDRGKKMYGTCLTVYEEFKLEHVSASSEEEGEVLKVLKRKSGVVHAQSGNGEDVEVTLQSTKNSNIVFVPKVLCLLSTWPYLHAFREYISQLYRLATHTNQMKAPIERYIINICEEIPAPPPGSFEIRMKICSSTIRFWAPPANQPIPYVSLPFQVLFECLDTANIIYVWYSLILEQKILLVSSQYSLLTICSEILCSLLFPMQWSHLYIPILPRFLSQMLDAPMPYLIGVSRDNLAHSIEDVSNETIIVDLDKNKITVGERTPSNPPMPSKRKTKLEDTLQKHAREIYWKARGLHEDDIDGERPADELERVIAKTDNVWKEKLEKYDDAFNLAFTPDSQSCNSVGTTVNSEQSRWDVVQEAFLRFYVSVLGDHSRFLSFKPRSADLAHHQQHTNSKNSFNMTAFIEAQKSSFRPFLQNFCRTQLFDDFITKVMYSPTEGDIMFFNQSITAKANRSKMTFKKKATPFLRSATAHKVLKKIDAVEPNTGVDDNTTTPNLLNNIYSNSNKNAKSFSYESWPETLDPDLFGEARPIPEIIAAEFDRRAYVAQRLRKNHYDDSLDNDFEAGDCYPSLSVGTFTVYLLIYCDVVGRELENARNKMKKDSDQNSILLNIGMTESDTKQETRHGLIPDRSLSLCSSSSDCHDGDEEKQSPKGLNTQSMENLSLEEKEPLCLDEAKIVATAQLDLAFSVLRTMSLRKLPIDSDGYRFMMEACGRCGNSQRASQLLRLMRGNGFAVDSEIYSKFVLAFTVSNELFPTDPSKSPLEKTPQVVMDDDVHETLAARSKKPPTGLFSKKKMLYRKGLSSLHSSDLSSLNGSSQESWSATGSTSLSTSSSLTGRSGRLTKGRIKKIRKLKKREDLQITGQIEKHISIGDSLLDFLYEDLELDTADACAKCSYVMSEDQIMLGWKLCSFSDYTTQCPQCKHRFVPRFTVMSSSDSFIGSQGLGTPLYCEFLSPWVLQKELHAVINTEEVGSIMKSEWRNGTDINATLWWNLIVAFRRHKLPITFLLQGSFKNQLIMPMPDN